LERSHNFKTRYVRVFYDPNSIENCWMKSEAGFEPLTIVPQQRVKYGGLRMEEVLDIIKILNQVAPDARYEDANTGALLQGRQERFFIERKPNARGREIRNLTLSSSGTSVRNVPLKPRLSATCIPLT
jgi:hypothetical protein